MKRCQWRWSHCRGSSKQKDLQFYGPRWLRVRSMERARSGKVLTIERRKKCSQVSLPSCPTIRRPWQRHLRKAAIKTSPNEDTWARKAVIHEHGHQGDLSPCLQLPSETARNRLCTESGCGRAAFPSWGPQGKDLAIACVQAWNNTHGIWPGAGLLIL